MTETEIVQHIARAIYYALPYEFDRGPALDYDEASDEVKHQCEVRARAALAEIRVRNYRVIALEPETTWTN